MMASSAVVSIAIAVVSWRLIEERALGHKDDFAARTRRLFNFGLARIGMAARPNAAGASALARLPRPEGRCEAPEDGSEGSAVQSGASFETPAPRAR